MKKPRGKSRSRAAKAANRYGKEKQEKRGSGKPGRTFIGRVQKKASGFAFLISPEAGPNDAYVNARDAAPLMDGDTVEFSLRSTGRKAEARVHQVIKRAKSEIVGRIENTRDGLVVADFAGELHQLQGARRGAQPGDWVVAHIDEYPTDRHLSVVSVNETLGPELRPSHDIALAVAKYGLQDQFSPAAIRDAEDMLPLAEDELRHLSEGRIDHRKLPFVTIDGEDAKDFDDAIYVERGTGKGPAFILYVAIADVSFCVRRGTKLDDEALRRSTSTYFPGVCIPMLPEVLSNELCSLRPQVDRLSMTAEIHYDKLANVVGSKFYASAIKTAHRLTYTQVQRFLDNDPQEREKLRNVTEPLNDAYELFQRLTDQRRKRGVLDFDLPESKIQVDAQGVPTGVKRAERFDAHKLIEEFMIAANQAVAKKLRESRALALYRVHEAPDGDSIEELNQLLRNLGVTHVVKEVSPAAFAKVLELTTQLKGAATIHQAVLRLQKQAKYEPDPKGHFGLALTDYAHFTSPIRRYPDLVVHRALKALTGFAEKADKEAVVDAFVTLGEITSAAERKSMEAERWVNRRKQCWYMLDHVGEEFAGSVSGMVAAGVFVTLPELALDGFIPIEFLDGMYEYDEPRKTMRKRPGHETLSVGDPIRIQVVKVSVDENQITFGQIGGAPREERADDEQSDRRTEDRNRGRAEERGRGDDRGRDLDRGRNRERSWAPDSDRSRGGERERGPERGQDRPRADDRSRDRAEKPVWERYSEPPRNEPDRRSEWTRERERNRKQPWLSTSTYNASSGSSAGGGDRTERVHSDDSTGPKAWLKRSGLLGGPGTSQSPDREGREGLEGRSDQRSDRGDERRSSGRGGGRSGRRSSERRRGDAAPAGDEKGSSGNGRFGRKGGRKGKRGRR